MTSAQERRTVRAIERRLMRLKPRQRHKLMSWAYFLNLREANMSPNDSTPRPWSVGPHGVIAPSVKKEGSRTARPIAGDPANGDEVWDFYGGELVLESCCCADEQLIVRAVNSHDALLEALRLGVGGLLDAIDNAADGQEAWTEHEPYRAILTLARKFRSNAEAAIAKAEAH